MAESTDDIDLRSVEVLIIDDHRIFGDAMAIAVNTQKGLRCRGAAPSAEVGLRWCEERCPDVVLLDVGLPGMGGIEAIGELHRLCPGVRIILITADTSGSTLVDAVEAGADGFLPKSHPFTEVLDAVRRVDQDVIAEPLSMRRAIAGIDEGSSAPHEASPDLTPREHEILVLLADGVPVKQVAARLGMTVNTCRGHVAALLHKFDAHSQLAAVIAAARLGLLPNLHTATTRVGSLEAPPSD